MSPHLKKPPVYRVIFVQIAITLLVTMLFAYFKGSVSAYSALLGGVICWLPNAYFAYKAFRFSGARAARDIAKSFYRGEAGKFVLTAVLFALVFSLVKPLDALALFVCFIVVMTVNWFTSLIIKF